MDAEEFTITLLYLHVFLIQGSPVFSIDRKRNFAIGHFEVAAVLF